MGGSAVKREYTVECADHGEMRRDYMRYLYYCKNRSCNRELPDTEVYRLVTGAPENTPVPIPIVVT